MLFFIILLILSSANSQSLDRNGCFSLNENAEANSTCKCVSSINELNIECSSYDEKNFYILPDIEKKRVVAKNAFTKWPFIPESFVNTIELYFNSNRIDSIGDLSNLINLNYLNLTNNLITKINPEICKLKKLVGLDLSYNLIEVISFKVFFCDLQSSEFEFDDVPSNLKYLGLTNNKIKEIYNLDLLFIGMPFLSIFEINGNKLINLKIRNLSNSSIKILNIYKEKINSSKILVSLFKRTFNNMHLYSFDILENPIERVQIKFEALFNVIKNVLNIDFNLLRKFNSFRIKSLNCDCNFYNDFKFFYDQFLNISSNITRQSLIDETICKNMNNTPIIDLITNNLINSSNCDNFLNESALNIFETCEKNGSLCYKGLTNYFPKNSDSSDLRLNFNIIHVYIISCNFLFTFYF